MDNIWNYIILIGYAFPVITVYLTVKGYKESRKR